jgi:sec-independent protein translocase protein TatA
VDVVDEGLTVVSTGASMCAAVKSGTMRVSIKGGRMFRSIGLPELIVILVVAVLLFGGKKIPELAKGLGEGIKNFKSALKTEEHNPSPSVDEKKQA